MELCLPLDYYPLKYLHLVNMCLCTVYVLVHIFAIVPLDRSHNLSDLILYFHYVGPQQPTQTSGLTTSTFTCLTTFMHGTQQLWMNHQK